MQQVKLQVVDAEFSANLRKWRLKPFLHSSVVKLKSRMGGVPLFSVFCFGAFTYPLAAIPALTSALSISAVLLAKRQIFREKYKGANRVPPSPDHALKVEDLHLSRSELRELKSGDDVFCEVGSVVPGDGRVITGSALIEELVTSGESSPVQRNSSANNALVLKGSRVLKGYFVVRLSITPGSQSLSDSDFQDTLIFEQSMSFKSLLNWIRSSVFFAFVFMEI